MGAWCSQKLLRSVQWIISVGPFLGKYTNLKKLGIANRLLGRNNFLRITIQNTRYWLCVFVCCSWNTRGEFTKCCIWTRSSWKRFTLAPIYADCLTMSPTGRWKKSPRCAPKDWIPTSIAQRPEVSLYISEKNAARETFPLYKDSAKLAPDNIAGPSPGAY